MGFWQLLAKDSEVAAVHAALLPTGEVVYYSGNTGPDIPAQVRVWNPATGEVRTPPNVPETDLFCSGHALLPDGRLFVAGGTGRYTTGPDDPWGGSKAAYIFDRNTGWLRLPDMSFGRWYPTVICLPDGRMLVAAGDDNGIPSAPIEIYNPFDGPAGGWQVLPESADRIMPLYPRLHVLPSGEVACAGQGAATAILDLGSNQWREVWPPSVGGGSGFDELRGAHTPGRPHMPHGPGAENGPAGPTAPEEPTVIVGPFHHPPGSVGPRPDDLAVLLPPAHFAKVLNAGGGNPAGTNTARIINFLDPTPEWRTIAPMHFPRWFPSSVILPDGRVLVTGGGRLYNADPVMESEIFDPETETWTIDATMNVPRLYHSTALLLPDGRVWMAGTDGEVRMELYSPDYLSAGPRPVIFAAPASVTYNQGFPIPMSEAHNVASVCFIRLGSVTHAFNTEQRLVPLPFTVTGPDEIEITAPPDPNVAPPGYYMLFIRNDFGVPAEAPIVQLVALPVQPPIEPPVEPAPIEEPVIEEPVVDVVIEEPVIEAPVEEVVVEVPVVEEPVAVEVVVEEPAPAEPPAPMEHPVMHSPAAVAAVLREALQLETLDELKARIEAIAAELEGQGPG